MTESRASLVAAVVLAAAFAVLAVLVQLGHLSGLDQWSVDHVMPGLGPSKREPSVISSLFPIFHAHKSRGHVAVSAATYAVVLAASVVPSVLLVGGSLLWLARRGRIRPALALGSAFVVANAVEVIGKAAIVRPALLHEIGGGLQHVVAFDSSYPSGHSIRAVFIAACLGACLPRLRLLLAGWVVAVAVMLVVGGWHTPSDVAGGLLVAVALWGLALRVARRPLAPDPPAP